VVAFIVRRVGQAIIVLLGVTVVVFILIHLIPGGEARAVLGLQAPPSEVRQFNRVNGFNKPLPEQYIIYLKNLLEGNLGYSYAQNQTVVALLDTDLPKTAVLVGIAFFIALIVGVPIGFYQAQHRNRPADHTVTGIVLTFYSMPVFWVGLLLVMFLAVKLHLFPPEAPQGQTVGAILAQPRALVLPIATLALVILAAFSRFARSSAVENLAQEFVRTARAKGASDWRIMRRHVARNAMLPVITLVGLSFPAVVSGAVIVESVFNYPGMGLLFWNAAISHDYPVLLGVTVVVAVATVTGSLVADLLYAFFDPRIAY